MPYDPDLYTDSDRDPLGYSSRSEQNREASLSRSVSEGVSKAVNGNGILTQHGTRREELCDSDDPGDEFYEDAQSEFGNEPEEYDNEVDLLQEPVDWEPVQNHTPRANPQPRPHNGFTGMPDALTPLRVAQLSQVAVVLNSTPQKEAYKAFNDDDLEEPDDPEGLDPIVTSDLIPSPKRIKSTIQPLRPDLKRKISDSAPALSPPKKRGRPAGWRPGQAYSTKIPGSTPKIKKSKPPGEAKQRGRPRRNQSPTPRQIYLNSNAKFNLYYCEWAGCPAKLQNLDTLRSHLLIVHGDSHRRSKQQTTPPPPPLTCKWHKCAFKDPPPLFLTLSDFSNHLDRTHLALQALHMGDGVKNTSPSSTSTTTTPLPRYLFSPDGTTQVTPSILDQELESDKDKKERLLRLERVQRQQQLNAPDEPVYTEHQAQQIAKALKAKKDLKNEYQEYYERVVERPRELEKMRLREEVMVRKMGGGSGVGVGVGVTGGLVGPRPLTVNGNGNGDANAGGAAANEEGGLKMSKVGPVYGPEWKGLMVG